MLIMRNKTENVTWHQVVSGLPSMPCQLQALAQRPVDARMHLAETPRGRGVLRRQAVQNLTRAIHAMAATNAYQFGCATTLVAVTRGVAMPRATALANREVVRWANIPTKLVMDPC